MLKIIHTPLSAKPLDFQKHHLLMVNHQVICQVSAVSSAVVTNDFIIGAMATISTVGTGTLGSIENTGYRATDASLSEKPESIETK